MKFEIETYKGQLIEYDDSYDKFVCDISIEDKYKTTKRLSLSEIRKEIDAFVKLNLDFKPFKGLKVSTYDPSSFEVITVTGIRTDGKFVIQPDGSSHKSYVGKKTMDRIMVYDADIVKIAQEIEDIKSSAYLKYKKDMTELLKPLIKVDISKYDSMVNQSE